MSMNIILQVILVTTILMMMTFMVALNKKMKSNTMTPFECGFSAINKSKMPLSIQFSMMTFLFLIFDVEISILIMSSWTMNPLTPRWMMTMMVFITMMFISIYYETAKNSSKWE